MELGVVYFQMPHVEERGGRQCCHTFYLQAGKKEANTDFLCLNWFPFPPPVDKSCANTGSQLILRQAASEWEPGKAVEGKLGRANRHS
jgi:hypothetical protein